VITWWSPQPEAGPAETRKSGYIPSYTAQDIWWILLEREERENPREKREAVFVQCR